MNSVKIKICGITNAEDAREAKALGADFLGLIFAGKSPRAVSLGLARAIIESSGVDSRDFAGVFVGERADFIKRAVDECGLGIVQLHGGQSDAFAKELAGTGAQIWRAVWLENDDDLRSAADMPADALLADSRARGIAGGTGETSNWDLARELSARRRTVLAGGLTPVNVAKALDSVKPWCLDANSGVEDSPRKKNFLKIEKLISEIKK